ncbi:hypothetical protein G7Y89_g445 [Cudoniella acicularis]|uniref:Uncharacterized protein n=1 Tax=Cudoniella acicularis TaxID=354080 RepID=A0A8H4RY37_9HELO|nr:hypothetical protein G7Y89_g445 [Cudoniella acicularis]
MASIASSTGSTSTSSRALSGPSTAATTATTTSSVAEKFMASRSLVPAADIKGKGVLEAPTPVKDEGEASGVPATPAEATLMLARAREKAEKEEWVGAYDAAQPDGMGLSALDPDYLSLINQWRARQKAENEREAREGFVAGAGCTSAQKKRKRDVFKRIISDVGV